MNPAAPHRATLTVLVGLAAAAVVAGLVADVADARTRHAAPARDAHRPRSRSAFAAVGLLAVVVWAIAQLSRAVRARARRAALEATVRGELSCGIRSRLLVQRLNEVANAERPVRLGARYSIVVDELGVAFWNGGRRPRRAAQFPWREVRNIRADSMVVGGAGRPRGGAARAARRRRASSCRSSCRRDAPCASPWPMRRSSRSCAAGRRSTAPRSRPRASSCRRSPRRSPSSRRGWPQPPAADRSAATR